MLTFYKHGLGYTTWIIYITVQGIGTSESSDLHTPPLEPMNFTSGSGNQNIESPPTFSQVRKH